MYSNKPPTRLSKASIWVINPNGVLSIIVDAPIDIDKIRRAL
jgi:hypothetical protein